MQHSAAYQKRKEIERNIPLLPKERRMTYSGRKRVSAIFRGRTKTKERTECSAVHLKESDIFRVRERERRRNIPRLYEERRREEEAEYSAPLLPEEEFF